LTIESAGERGQVVLSEIPHVEKVQSELYELVEADHDSHTFGDDDRDALAKDITRASRGKSRGDDDDDREPVAKGGNRASRGKSRGDDD
jgi:hypothetical protein